MLCYEIFYPLVSTKQERDRSTNIFCTGLLNHDGSRRNGELPAKAGAHIHKVRGSGLDTEKTGKF